MHFVSEMHLKETKRILRYIKGSVNYGVSLRSVKASSYINFQIVIRLDLLIT
jgi:hypothetical protein